jgi:hypothetical protein
MIQYPGDPSPQQAAFFREPVDYIFSLPTNLIINDMLFVQAA